MARQWTDAQKQAIESRDGTVLVSAAAGSGKTAVLVERVIEYITDQNNPVDIEKLLVVTFTKAAAAEMKERISKRLGELICEQPENQYLKRQKMYLPNAQISTIDSFCSKLVKDNFEKADVAPDFTALSDVEHKIMKQEVAVEVLEELYSLPVSETDAFLRLFSNGRSDEGLINSILSLYEFAMASQNPEFWIETAFSDYFDDLPIHETRWGKYCLNRVESILKYIVIKANDIIADAPENSSLFGAFTNDLTPIISSVENILKMIEYTPEKWDEIRTATELVKFNRIPTVPKDEKDCYYDELKARRDSIKKYLESATAILICNEKEYKEDMEYLRPIMSVLKKCTTRFMKLLSQRKNENNAYYFSDILHLTLKILVDFNEDGTYTKTTLAKELSENYAEILIDEFQDNNEAQDTLFSVISNNNGNKFMVGDVKQSVYRFRQAMPQIFMRYKDSFEEFKGDNYPAVIGLDKNFRSREGVIKGINYFFDFLMTRNTCGIDYSNGEQLAFGGNYELSDEADVSVHIVETNNQKSVDLVAEARHIGTVIKELVSSGTLVGKKDEEHPIQYKDICILMKSVKDKAHIVARELNSMGIPAHFQKKGGFFESREVMTMTSMLKVIDNPVQDVPLVSVMLSPLFPFTEDDLAKYRCNERHGSFYNVIKKHYDTDEKVKAFLDSLSVFRTLSVTMDVGSLIRRVLEYTSYDSIVGAMDNGEKRVLNIEMLINYAENYEASGGSGLSGFIRYLEKIRKYDKSIDGANEISESDNVVRIMTIHKSKGLEFPVVFVANCSSMFNRSEFSKVRINRNLGVATSRYFPDIHKDITTLPVNTIRLFDNEEDSAEQIRALYVAMTRAEEKLYLVGAMHNPIEKIEKLYYSCYGNFVDNTIPILTRSNFMQWIILAMMNHPALDYDFLLNRCINPDSPNIDFGIFEKIETIDEVVEEKKIFECDDELLNTVSEKLAYKYLFKSVSDIPIKYAASAVKSEQNFKYLASENPAFYGSGEFTPAQRGTLTHRFMEICDFDRAYHNIDDEIARVVDKNLFVQKEADALNINNVKAFFKSDVYNRIRNAEKYLREQEFSMLVSLSQVNENVPDVVKDESVIVQGIIDGLIVNGENGEIVDYKTDRVDTMEELCERYKEQMNIYKKAAKECFGLQNITVTLYSFHLSKEISLKL